LTRAGSHPVPGQPVTDFGLTSFTPIIVSSVLATAITRSFYGNVTEFTLPEFTMVSLWEFLLYLVLGVIAGIIGHAFSRSLYIAEDTFNKTRLPDWIRASIGGLCVGIVALGFPHIMGVGYDTIRVMLEGDLTWKLMLLLVLLKIVMTAVTIGSGGSGGIFAPSLFIGSMLGGAFGIGVNALFPAMTGTMGAYAIVGMAAVNSASTLAPLSAIIILVELTNNYGIILPLMFTVVMATFVSRKLSSLSIYTRKLVRRGITPFEGEDINILRAINVNDVIRHEDRRELRGARLLAAWTNHFDAREQNTLSMFAEQDGRPFGRRARSRQRREHEQTESSRESSPHRLHNVYCTAGASGHG